MTTNFLDIGSIYKGGEIQELISSLRTVKGALLFITLYAIRPLFIILPASPMAAAGGAIYGTFLGTAIVVIGALISGTIGFFMARFIGKGYLDKIKHSKILRIKNKIEENQEKVDNALNSLNPEAESLEEAVNKILEMDVFFPKRKMKGYILEIYKYWEGNIILKHIQRSKNFES